VLFVINKLLIFFIVLPMVELVLLTILSHYTSITTTILFIIGTGILGTWLAHSQGWSTYRRIQQELAQGRMPTDSLIDGVLILIAGILLISPGVLTDVVGIILMLPPSRVFFRRWLVAWFKRNFQVQSFVPRSQTVDRDVVDSYATEPTGPKSRTTVESHSPRLDSRE
jgi:UPF0716 protein FxsA